MTSSSTVHSGDFDRAGHIDRRFFAELGRRLASQRPAQLAHHAFTIEEHQFADQRRTVAVGAAMPALAQRPHAGGHEVDLARRRR